MDCLTLIYISVLVSSVVGQEHAIYTPLYDGSMSPFEDQPDVELRVWHLEIDVTDSNQLIFADGATLKTFDRFTKVTSTIAGYNEPPEASAVLYREGIGSDARFSQVTGFTKHNMTHITVVDKDNNCIRSIDCATNQTSVLAGLCGAVGGGYNNSNLEDSRFSSPTQIASNQKSSHLLYVTDSSNNAVRVLDLEQDKVTTLIQLTSPPRALLIDELNINCFVTTNSKLIQIRLSDKHLINNINSAETGFKDGPLSTAKISKPGGITQLHQRILLIAEMGNNRLRVVDLNKGEITSICTGESTFSKDRQSLDSCHMDNPTAAIVMSDKEKQLKLFIGTRSSNMRVLDMTRRRPPPPPCKGQKGRPPRPPSPGDGRPPRPGDGRPDGPPPPPQTPPMCQITESSPTPVDPTDSQDHLASVKQTKVIIVSVIVVGVVLVVAIVAAVFLLYKRAKLRRQVQQPYIEDYINRNAAKQGKCKTKPCAGQMDADYRRGSEEYNEIDETYFEVRVISDSDSTARTPPGKRSTRYGLLPHRPTTDGEHIEDGDQVDDEHKYYYATPDLINRRSSDSGILSSPKEEVRSESAQLDDGYADNPRPRIPSIRYLEFTATDKDLESCPTDKDLESGLPDKDLKSGPSDKDPSCEKTLALPKPDEFGYIDFNVTQHKHEAEVAKKIQRRNCLNS